MFIAGGTAFLALAASATPIISATLATSAAHPLQLSISNSSSTWKQNTKPTSIVRQSRGNTSYNGGEQPTEPTPTQEQSSCNNGGGTTPDEAQDPTTDKSKGEDIHDIIDKLPRPPGAPGDENISTPFEILAWYVSYREEKSLPVTSDDLVQKFSFSDNISSLAQELAFLTYENNWTTILNAFQERYSNDYPAIQDALNTLKDQATQCARVQATPTEEPPTPPPTEVQATPTPESPESGSIGETPPTPEPVTPTPTEVQATPTPTEEPPTPTPTVEQPTPTQEPPTPTPTEEQATPTPTEEQATPTPTEVPPTPTPTVEQPTPTPTEAPPTPTPTVEQPTPTPTSVGSGSTGGAPPTPEPVTPGPLPGAPEPPASPLLQAMADNPLPTAGIIGLLGGLLALGLPLLMKSAGPKVSTKKSPIHPQSGSIGGTALVNNFPAGVSHNAPTVPQNEPAPAAKKAAIQANPGVATNGTVQPSIFPTFDQIDWDNVKFLDDPQYQLDPESVEQTKKFYAWLNSTEGAKILYAIKMAAHSPEMQKLLQISIGYLDKGIENLNELAMASMSWGTPVAATPEEIAIGALNGLRFVTQLFANEKMAALILKAARGSNLANGTSKILPEGMGAMSAGQFSGPLESASLYKMPNGTYKILIGDSNKIYNLSESQITELSKLEFSKWGPGSIGNSVESFVEHYIKHGEEVGAKSLTQYFNKAIESGRMKKGSGKLVEGATAGVKRYDVYGSSSRYVDVAPDGTVISFGSRYR